MKEINDLKTLWNQVKDYLELRVEHFRLGAVEKVSRLMADLVSSTMVIVFIMMAALSACVTLAFYLSEILGSYTKGFGCATLAFLLLAIIVIAIKDKYIEKWIANFTIRRYFEKHCDHEEEDCNKVN